MGLALLDYLTPWKRNRVQVFLADAGAAHAYMVHVGVGWMLARMRQRIEPSLARLNPLLGWLAVDGYGFHEGYFHASRYVEQQAIPRGVSLTKGWGAVCGLSTVLMSITSQLLSPLFAHRVRLTFGVASVSPVLMPVVWSVQA
jgi:hypothetical protein